MRKGMLLVMLHVGIALLFLTLPAQAYTTEVHVIKYAADCETMLNETTVNYTWMEENLPVQGDGSTHYYFQGPIFEEEWENTYSLSYIGGDWGSSEEKWDRVDRGSGYVQEEQCNCYPDKDLGACKGTAVRDLCNLVGGMSPGDEVKVKSVDGFFKMFPYAVIYNNEPALGPYVVTWYSLDAKESGAISGYTGPDYTTGMRAMFFSDTSSNPWSEHITGIADMTNYIPEEYWHYYVNLPIFYPALGGYTVKYVSEIAIYSSIEPPEVSLIEVSPLEMTVNISDTQQFNATAYDQSGTEMLNIIFMWASSDESVGTIDDTGLFTAMAAGDTTITAENVTVEGMASVTVSSPTPTPTRHHHREDEGSSLSTPVLTTINISPSSVLLNVSETQRFNATAYNEDGNEMPDIIFNWTSSNKTVGTISDTGFFVVNVTGTTTIKATNETVHGTEDVTVTRPTVTPTPTPTETPQVNVTHSPSPTPRPTHIPSPSATPTPSTQGFEALFAIIGVLAVIYVIKWRKL